MQIKAPDLGVDSADVSEVLVKVGDSVEKEQSLLIVESAKASVEVPSPAKGVIKSIAITQGQTIKQNDVLFELENTDTEQPEEAKPAQASDTDHEKNQDTQPEPLANPEPQTGKNDSGGKQAHNTTSEQDIKVPDLGVDKADVSEILVKVGDLVEKEQSLLVVESAKASVEIPSPVNGVIKSIAITQGQKIKQGMVILTIEAGSDQKNDKQQSFDQKSNRQPNADQQPSNKPKVSDQPDNQDAEKTEDQHSVASQSTSNNSPEQQASDSQSDSTLTPEQIKANSDVYAGPAVRQLARQLGVELSQVKSSGANQRIVKEDVFAFVKNTLSSKSQATNSTTPLTTGLPPLPNFEQFGGSTIQPMTRLQQVSVPQLSLNNYIPQVTQFDLADITELENWRNQLKADYKQQEISLTILAFIIKATAYLLQQEKLFNSHLGDNQKSIVLRNEIHMGIAVATDDGLTVPILRNPDQLSIKDIAIQLGELSQKARDKKLKPQELQGASFTVTSLGSIGGTAFTPLVNWPQVAILGISPASMQAIWNGHDFQPRLMLPLSLSYDHRVINGADAARFSHALVTLLADIRRILL